MTDAVQNAQTVLDERQAAADAARAALDAKQAEYDARLAVCREQLRAMQRLDGGGAVWLLAQAKSLYQLLTFDAVLQQMSARNSTVLAELDAEAAALEQARAAADEAAGRPPMPRRHLSSSRQRWPTRRPRWRPHCSTRTAR